MRKAWGLLSAMLPMPSSEERPDQSSEAEFPTVSFNTVNGDPILFDPPIQGDEQVGDVRRRAGAALGLHWKTIALLCGAGELRDDQTMQHALRDAAGVAAITVLQKPCQIEPSDYEAYIDRGATGFMEVGKIRYEFGHPVEFARTDDDGGGFHGGSRNGKPREPREPSELDGRVEFPPPMDIQINMMPFIMGNKASIPEEYQQYWPLIEKCILPPSEHGKVGYLTIDEGWVQPGQAQRRGGLHIEAPGNPLHQGGAYTEQRIDWGCGIVRWDRSTVDGGLYMASNVPNSCRVWNAQIRDSPSVVGKLGSLEHIRDVLGEGAPMEAGKLYWLTDTTPHESLPLEEKTYRQYFRLVTSSLSAWYPEHSTPNSLGVEPDSEITQVVAGNKFA